MCYGKLFAESLRDTLKNKITHPLELFQNIKDKAISNALFILFMIIYYTVLKWHFKYTYSERFVICDTRNGDMIGVIISWVYSFNNAADIKLKYLEKLFDVLCSPVVTQKYMRIE